MIRTPRKERAERRSGLSLAPVIVLAGLAFLSGAAPAIAQAPPGSISNPRPLSCAMVANACGSQQLTRSALGTPAFYTGTGAPASTLGTLGDYYIRSSTGQLYQNVAGTWTVLASLVGPTGPTGATGATGTAGATWSQGSGVPSGGLGANGDFYLRTDTAQLYNKSGGAWSVTVSLVSLSGTNVFTGFQTWKGFSETYSAPAISAGTLTIDLTQGTFFNVASSANLSTFTITNATASKASSFTLVLTGNGTAYTQSWGSVRWPGGIAPILTSTNAKADWLTFITNDGGTTWFGFIAGQSL